MSELDCRRDLRCPLVTGIPGLGLLGVTVWCPGGGERTVLSSFRVASHLISVLGPLFPALEAEAQGGEAACSGSHSSTEAAFRGGMLTL